MSLASLDAQTVEIANTWICPSCGATLAGVGFAASGDVDDPQLPYCSNDWPENDGVQFDHRPGCAYLAELEHTDLVDVAAFADYVFSGMLSAAGSVSPILGLPSELFMARWEWELSTERVGSWTYNGKQYVAPTARWSDVDVAAQHYPGGNVLGSRWNPADPIGSAIGYARYLQHSYIATRGYSIGYCWAVMPDGRVVELRGRDYKCAANRDHNGHTNAIQYMVDLNTGLTPAQRLSGQLLNRQIFLWQLDAGGVDWFGIIGHNELRKINGQGTATSCCGAPIYAELHKTPWPDGGDLHWRNLPTEPPPSQENPMSALIICKAPGGAFHIGDCLWREYETNPPALAEMVRILGPNGLIIDASDGKTVTSLAEVGTYTGDIGALLGRPTNDPVSAKQVLDQVVVALTTKIKQVTVPFTKR